MALLHDHRIGSPLNDVLQVEVLDPRDPAAGNMSHEYRIWAPDDGVMPNDGQFVHISFQHGPIKEVGVNGISNEALVAIVLDRLRGAQGGDFACRENACAITKFEEGLMWLHHRTADRLRRGVEGQSKK